MDAKNPRNEEVDTSGVSTTPPEGLRGISEQGDPNVGSVLETVPQETENILNRPIEWGLGAHSGEDTEKFLKQYGPRSGGSKTDTIFPQGNIERTKPIRSLEEVFADLDEDIGSVESTPHNKLSIHGSSSKLFTERPTKHPLFRPLLRPEPIIPVPKKQGLFGAFKDIAKKTKVGVGSFLQRHMGITATTATAVIAAGVMVLNSNSKNDHHSHARVSSLPQTSQVQTPETNIIKMPESVPPAEDIYQLAQETPLVQDVVSFEEERDLSGTLQSAEPLVVDTIAPLEEPELLLENSPKEEKAPLTQVITPALPPRELTPFEKGLQAMKNVSFPTSTKSLTELVLGKVFFQEKKKIEEPQNIVTEPEEPEVLPVTETLIINTHSSTIPLFVISNGKETAYIPDRDQDGKITVDEERLGFFGAIPGGNRARNTGKMFRLADQLGVKNSGDIRPGKLLESLEYSDIMSGTPVTKTLTVNGLTYTISANTAGALKRGEEKLTGLSALVNAKGKSTPPADTENAPKAIIVPEPDTENAPKAIPVLAELEDTPTEEVGVLPSKPTTPISPVISRSEKFMTQRALSYNSAREWVLGNGKYEGSHQVVLPISTYDAQATIEGWLGIVDAIQEVSTEKETLLKFYKEHVSVVDGKGEKISLDTFLKEHVKCTDLQMARAMGKEIPENFVDDKPHDGKIPELVGKEGGTWDTNGWVEARELVNKGAKSVYGEYPTMAQYDEYFRKNVSLGSHPEVDTYRKLLMKVQEEIRTEETRK